jgi:hypothetical protein
MAMLMSIGAAEILNVVCHRNGSQSAVCQGVRGGLISQ